MRGNNTKLAWHKWQIAMFCLFLIWFLTINLVLAWQESQTIDEAAHITAGYSYLTTRDFRLNPEHPPLLKELSALPLIPLDTKNVRSLSAWDKGDQWKSGKEFVYHSKASPKSIIFTARLAPIFMAICLGILVFALATFLANRSYGLIAFGLYCLDPNIIAHSHLVTTDIASALGFLLVFAVLFMYVEKPTLKRLAIVGLALGIALGFKYSTILLLPFIFVLISFSVFYFEKPRAFWLNILNLTKKMLFIGLIAALFVFAIYGFEVVKPSSSIALAGNLAHENGIFRRIQDFYVPLYSYLRGLGRVLIHSQSQQSGNVVYLLGNYSSGSWYYFIYAFFIKTPLVLILASLAALSLGVVKLVALVKNKSKLTKKALYTISLVAFILVYFLASTVTYINIGWRHILPIYPALFVLIAVALCSISSKFHNSIKTFTIIALLLLGNMAASLFYHMPYLISYSNELLPIVSSASHRPRLTDSNLDWGQDVYRLVDYANNNPNKQFRYQIFTNADLSQLELPSNLKIADNFLNKTNCNSGDGIQLIISYQIIYNDPSSTTFDCLRGSKPTYTIGSSILVFN